MRLVVVFVLLALLVTWTVVAETSRREADLLNARTELLHTGAAAMLEGFVSRGRVLQSVLLRDDRTLDVVSRLTASDAGARDEATRTFHALLESRQTALQGQGYDSLSLRDARGGLLLPLGSPVDQRPLTLPVLRALESRGQVWGVEAGDRFAFFRMIHVLEDEGERVGYLDTSLSRAVVLKALALSLPGVALDLVLDGSAVGAAVLPGSPGVAPSSLGPSFVRELPPPGGGGLDDGRSGLDEGHFGLRDPGGLVEEALARAPREALSAGLARGQAFALFVDGGPDATGVIALLPLFDLEGKPIGLMTGFWPGTERIALWTQAFFVLAIGLGLILVLGGVALVLRQTWIRAERERRRLVTVTDTMGEGLYGVDRAGRVVMVNEAACRLLGFTEAEVLGQPAHELFHAASESDPSPGPLHTCPVHQAQNAGGTPSAVSAWFRRKDGVVLAVEITCSLMAGPMSVTARSWGEGVIGLLLGEGRSRPRDGDPAAVVTFVDVTEQRRHEASLLKLSRAVEQSSASVVITDAQGQIEYVNPAFCQITGYTPEEVLGRTPAMLKSGRVPAEIYRDMWQTIASGREWRGEFHNRRKDGTLYWEHATISPIKNEEGKITHFVAVKDDITQKKEIEEELFHRANYDPLTGLPNRQLLLDRLNTALAVARRESHRVAVMFMDLDRFKQVNDTLGHNAGDVLLKQAASRLSAVLRPQDTLGRLGGDEFLVVAPGLHKPSEATVVAGRLLDVARQPFTVDGRDIYVSASIGICLGPGDGTSPQILMRNADAAMYLAKENGRDGFHFFTPEVESASRRRMMIETGLRSAVRDGSLSLLYQPIFAARDGRMTKAEALLRWSHPQLGPVSPAEFIDVAEETGQILALGSWVLEEACRNLANLEVSGGGAFRIAVNISSKQFGQDLSTQIQGLLERHALDPRRLEIEITERVLLHPSAEVLGQLEALRALGVSIAIDDFGTGYSALSYLMAFRIDTLKIDRSFVVAMEKDVRSQALVGAITGMAHDLDARVVAEGVETAEQAALLSSLGVDALQGFLLGRPMPLDSLQSLLFRTGAVALAPL